MLKSLFKFTYLQVISTLPQTQIYASISFQVIQGNQRINSTITIFWCRRAMAISCVESMSRWGDLCSVNLGLHFTAPKLAQENEEIPAESLGENGIEERVCAGVDGVKQNQEDLGVSHCDERNLEWGWYGKERYWCHAEEVSEDQDGHALGNLCIAVGRDDIGVAHGEVDAGVADANHDERKNIQH